MIRLTSCLLARLPRNMSAECFFGILLLLLLLQVYLWYDLNAVYFIIRHVRKIAISDY
jgi:hypothetical protein